MSSAAFKIVSVSNFCILITMCLGVGLSGFISFRTFCASWTCMSVFFTNLRNFSAIIFSNRFSISYTLSPPSGTLWCKCWYTWSCPRGSLHYPEFLDFFSFFLFFDGKFFTSLYSKSLILSLIYFIGDFL